MIVSVKPTKITHKEIVNIVVPERIMVHEEQLLAACPKDRFPISSKINLLTPN
jgi:hypothetical protein